MTCRVHRGQVYQIRAPQAIRVRSGMPWQTCSGFPPSPPNLFFPPCNRTPVPGPSPLLRNGRPCCQENTKQSHCQSLSGVEFRVSGFCTLLELGGVGELVAVSTAWSQDGESNFSCLASGRARDTRTLLAKLCSVHRLPHRLFLSHRSARRAQCVLSRGEDRWGSRAL